MKISANELPGFVPRELTITVESPAELNAVYALFNSTWIDMAVKAGFEVNLPTTPPAFAPETSNACETLHDALHQTNPEQ